MSWLRFGVLAVGSFTTTIMLLAICAYVAALPGKTQDTWYLLGYLASLFVLLLSYTARYSLFTPLGLATGQVSNLIVFGLVCLIQFAYRFGGLEREREREASVVLVLSLVLAFCVWGVNFFRSSAPRVYDFAAEYFTYEYGPHVSMYVMTGYIWAFSVLMRRASRRRGAAGVRAPVGEKGPDRRFRLSLARFAGLVLMSAGLAAVYLLFQTGVVARAVYATVFNSASLLIALQIFVVYLNDAPQPSSFLAKLVGLPLATLLVGFGIASTFVTAAQNRALTERYVGEARALALNADPRRDLASSPAVAYVAGVGQDGAIDLRFLASDIDRRWPARVIAAVGRPGPLGASDAPARFVYLDLWDTRTFFFEYSLSDARVGFRYADYRGAVHRGAARMAAVVAAAALAVILGFPVASRRGLLRPLALLLEGGRQVEGGNYAATVPVVAEDELGRLAQAFNGMVRSVRDAEGNFKALAESAGDAILVISAEGRILYANRTAAQVSGHEREGLLGRFFGDLVAADERQRMEERFASRLSGGEVATRTETRVLGPAGEEIAVEVAGARTVWHDRSAGVVILRDIRERRAAEEKLRAQAEQLARADKLASLGVLVASVAHEVGNPTQVVAHDARFLGEGLPSLFALAADAGQIDDAVRVAGMPYADFRRAAAAAVREIEASAARIERMVADLKDFARESRPEPLRAVDINEVVATVVELAGRFVRDATSRFSVALCEGLPPVLGERVRIEQVLLNLLQNACQALPDRSRGVSVRTRYDREVLIEVADEGVGIPPEDLARITEPFFTTRRERGGTGLGLVVTERIVREHGGRLLFRSEVDRGTIATVALPAAPGA